MNFYIDEIYTFNYIILLNKYLRNFVKNKLFNNLETDMIKRYKILINNIN